MDDDEELLKRWVAGAREAGNALVTRHFTLVHRFMRGIAPGEADELTQRTFLGLLESAKRPDAERPRHLRAYLLGIARKQVLRLVQERRPEASLEELSRTPAGRLFDSPTSIMRKAERQHALMNALRELPTETQLTLQMHYWGELPVADIAELTGVAVGTVRSRLTRGRQSLNRLLTP